MSRHWTKRETQKIAHYPVFDLRKDICISPRTGGELHAYILETRDWVNIIPITPEREVVMVQQYRFASEEITLEIPGGLTDDSDATYVESARRELREETGYASDRIYTLGSCRPNPAILNNTCHLFLALDVVQKYEQEQDDGEDIQIVLIPYEKIPSMILDGSINHALVLNAFHLLDLHYQSQKVAF